MTKFEEFWNNLTPERQAEIDSAPQAKECLESFIGIMDGANAAGQVVNDGKVVALDMNTFNERAKELK